MRALKITAWIGLLFSLVWLLYDPGFEPAAATIAGALALGGMFVKERGTNATKTNSQNQKVSDGSTGIQAGGSVQINTRNSSRNE